MRLWMENAFLWLAEQFGKDNIATKPMLLPTTDHFPIRYDGSKECLIKTAEIIGRQMEIDINNVTLDIYDQSIQEFIGDLGHRTWTEVDKNSNERLSAGLYLGKNEYGKYDILIEKKNLTNPENLVATLSHELAHIRLLGENRLNFNDELLTDLSTVVFGLGIFNANASFREHKSPEGYMTSSLGYLKQREWGYALALYAFYKQEENPDWIKFLNPNLKSDLKKGLNFILANEKKYLQKITN